jgi:two-component system chemotaxis response regulator CheB
MNARVLIVDDSAFMRMALRRIVSAEEGLCVVGEAKDGAEALAMARTLHPDIVTMDVEMAGMDGLAATTAILAEAPPHPVIIMVSQHTQAGAAATVEALHRGAADWISKSSAVAAQDLGQIDTQLRAKLRFWAAETGGRPEHAPAPPGAAFPEAAIGAVDLVVVASSLGGPKVLGPLLLAAGRLTPPVVIAQHMPAGYTASLADILRTETGLPVTEGAHRMPLTPGSVTILPGGTDAMIGPGGGRMELRLERTGAPVHPNADLLFSTAAMVARGPVGVILTGMGEDGTAGARKLRGRRRPVLVQDPASCIVGGMPGAAIAAGVASEVLGVAAIGQRLAQWAGAGAGEMR